MSVLAIATYILVCVSGLAYIGFFIVVTIGGFFDLLYLLKSLKEEALDSDDDGRVATKIE
jgi:hypothetical protein